jgi:hypothetical protein
MKYLATPTHKKRISYFLIALILFYSYGCNYFKVKNLTPNDIVSIRDIGEMHKYFLVHSESEIFSLNEISIDTTSISGRLSTKTGYVYYSEGRKYRMNKTENGILNEVHIYLYENSEDLQLGFAEIPFSSIKSIKIIEKDNGKTTASYVFGGLGIVFGVMVIVTIISALLKSSCPYVYVFDGESFVFEGETFGGAIAPNLQRDDYMPLPSLKTSDDTYRIRISNELKERQYTDLAQLVVVEHPVGKSVLLDKSGEPQLISMVESPVEAISFNGNNLQQVLKEKDDEVYFFNDEDYSVNGMTIKFKKPQDASLGKVVLNAKNTLWFDYLFGEFLGKFGGFYNEWMDKQSALTTQERMQKVIENDFPLTFYIKSNGEWKLIDYLLTVGPLASRDFVIPIDLSNHHSDEVEIKMETGFMFWEMDFVGMDFSENQNISTTNQKPTLAFGTGSMDWTSALEEKDNQYMAQENVGEVTEVVFRAMKAQEGFEQTCFLHTSGYYELIRKFEGLPKLTELSKFKQPGYFSEFSRIRYLHVLDRGNTMASVKSIN